MLPSKRTLGKLLTMIFLGAFIGTMLGKVIALLMPAGVVKDFFLIAWEPTILAPTPLDLGILTLTLGITFDVNVVGLIGVFVAVYILKWY